MKKENEIYKEKLNKYEPVSVLIEDEIQVNDEAACSSHDHSYNSSNELPSNCEVQSTFSNEIPLAVVNGAQSTIEVQQCDEVSSNSIVTFDRVVSVNIEFSLIYYLIAFIVAEEYLDLI